MFFLLLLVVLLRFDLVFHGWCDPSAMERTARADDAISRWGAAGPNRPALLVGLGFDCGELKDIGVPPALIEPAWALATFREGCCDVLSRDDWGADNTCSETSWWRPVVATTVCVDILAKDGDAGDGPVEFLQPLMHWIPSLSFVMQVQYLHMQKGMIYSTLCFFTQADAALCCLSWCGSVSEVHGMIELLEANMLHCLHHIHQHPEDAPNLKLIFICRYANLVLHHIYMEITVSGHWTIIHAAQSLDCLNWNQFSSVNLWSQGSTSFTILQYNYVRTQELPTNGRQVHQNEQDYFICYGCTRLSLMDGTHAGDIVPLLFGLCHHRRWTTAPSSLILRFNRGDFSSLSSVKAIQYLQLNAHKPQVHTPDRPLGESTMGHQLVWSTNEALGDCNCSKFEPGLSPDKRQLFDSSCFFFNKERPEGPGSISLIPNGGCISYYKGPHKIRKNI